MRLLPVLKPNDWPGIDSGVLAHVWEGTTDKPAVVVVYAEVNDDEQVIDYVTEAEIGASQGDGVVRQAFLNLEHYHTDFEVVEFGSERVLVAAGRQFGAERALCQSHMLRAHDKLGAPQIVVSIARRGLLLAAPYECSEEVKQTIVKLHNEAWSEGASTMEQIINELIVFEGGRKVRTIPLPPTGDLPSLLWI